MLAIISGPQSPSSVQASHASARKPRYSGLWTLARGEPLEQPVSAFGLLGGALDDAANQKELRVVASMQFGIDSLHADTPVEKKSLSSRQHCASQSGRAIIGRT